MKYFLAIMLVTGLTGCVTTQSAQVGFVDACSAYNAAFQSALSLRQAGKLNEAQIKAVSDLDAQATPLCTGPLPTDPTAATSTVTAAVTTLTTEIIVQKVSK